MAINRKASSEVKNDKRGEKKCNNCNGMRKRITKILRKSTQEWDRKHKSNESTMYPNSGLSAGHLLSPLICAAFHCSQRLHNWEG